MSGLWSAPAMKTMRPVAVIGGVAAAVAVPLGMLAASVALGAVVTAEVALPAGMLVAALVGMAVAAWMLVVVGASVGTLVMVDAMTVEGVGLAQAEIRIATRLSSRCWHGVLIPAISNEQIQT